MVKNVNLGDSTRTKINPTTIASNVYTDSNISVQAEITNLRAKDTELTTKVNTNTSNIATNASDITNLKSRATSLESSVATNTANIIALDTKVDENANIIIDQNTHTRRIKVWLGTEQQYADLTNKDSDTLYFRDRQGEDIYVTVARNTANIEANTQAIAVNRSNIQANTNAISVNADNITSLQNTVASQASDITANTNAIALNSSAIQQNRQDIATNSSAIQSNTNAITVNSNNIAKRKLIACEGYTALTFTEDMLIVLDDLTEIIELDLQGDGTITFDTSALTFPKKWYTFQIRCVFDAAREITWTTTDGKLTWINGRSASLSEVKPHWLVVRIDSSKQVRLISDAGSEG